ncbi:50S ribosomal protein L4 [Candidatus Woesearchaeota archaeon]|nr:50S ribosomal protein L4 [Candidatus Woesearchaeota archaeon]
MKIGLYNKTGERSEEFELPKQFDEVLRTDLIKKAVLAVESNNRQPYGAYKEAGKEVNAKLSRRRHDYKGSYGFGISRVPRKILSRRGTRMNWVGAFAPGTVGGRRAHPPKAEKNWNLKINAKEKRFAIRSAISATVDTELVKARGHIIPSEYPLGFASDVEDVVKSADLMKLLSKLGFDDELGRGEDKKVRAGKGKMRSRPFKVKKSLLIVVSQPCKLSKAAANLPGVDIIEARKLNAQILAPGTHPGRATLFTKNAIEELAKNNLFMK